MVIEARSSVCRWGWEWKIKKAQNSIGLKKCTKSEMGKAPYLVSGGVRWCRRYSNCWQKVAGVTNGCAREKGGEGRWEKLVFGKRIDFEGVCRPGVGCTRWSWFVVWGYLGSCYECSDKSVGQCDLLAEVLLGDWEWYHNFTVVQGQNAEVRRQSEERRWRFPSHA